MNFIYKDKSGKEYMILYDDNKIIISDIILKENVINNINNNLNFKNINLFNYYLHYVVGVKVVKTRIKVPTKQNILKVLKRNNII